MRNKKWYIGILITGFILADFITNGEEGFIYNSHGKKDPFAPPVLEEEGKLKKELLLGIKLKAIIWDRQRPLALINDKVVGIGDTIAGGKIVDIKENEVIFLTGKQKVTIKLRKREELEKYGL